MTLLAKEGDVVPGGSMTRLATETYVDTHAGGGDVVQSTDPFIDDFSTDTLADYTYVLGAQNQFSIAGGSLNVVTQAPAEKMMRPTDVPARKEFGILAQFHPGNNGNGFWLAKVIDANNYIMLGWYGPDGVSLYQRQGGVMTRLQNAVVGGVASGDPWLRVEFRRDVGILEFWDADPRDPATTMSQRLTASRVWDLPGFASQDVAGYPALNIEPVVDTSIAIREWGVYSLEGLPVLS